ncbi:MAG: DUF58 domain-containing protein [Synergistaceae bacterium]|jgi:uncharacterized protein (DUF58 family)|nr:DUF58 domain-containing protein [Synergistaceae bacterium]
MKVISINRSGIIYCAMSIVMGVVAVNGGNNFHYLATGALLGYMAASGITGWKNIRNAEIDLSFPDEIYAGAPFLLNVEVRNKGRSPIFLIDAKVGEERVFFPVIQPKETVSKTVLFSLPTRGVCVVDDVELSSTYPFNFFTRYRPSKFERQAMAFPAPRAWNAGEVRMWAPSGDGLDRKARDPDAGRDVIGVRPYVEGDAMKIIHWKSSARTGRLNSRLYDGGEDAKTLVIDLDALMSLGVEAGLSMASYEISHSIKSGSAIGMTGCGMTWAPSASRAGKLAMLAALALHE